MRTLSELQAECSELGISPNMNGRPNKEPWIDSLRQYYWNRDHADQPLPPQIQPMLLADWNGLDPGQTAELESDHNDWIVQPKLDGVRALMHIEEDGIRITGRRISKTTYRLTEYQANLLHLTTGFEGLQNTILDGELVCPEASVNTGSTITANPLRAAVAILATSPENAAIIQQEEAAKLRFHVFDILRYLGQDVTGWPLHERLDLLTRFLPKATNTYVDLVPSFSVNKPAVHEKLIEQGGEGTVWKRSDQPYEPGGRVKHWIKRKREVQIEAFVSGFKAGSANRGHAHLIGALEFSVQDNLGQVKPIAWVCGWKDTERRSMSEIDGDGTVTLNPSYIGRRAILIGYDVAERSGRFQHARLRQWITAETEHC